MKKYILSLSLFMLFGLITAQNNIETPKRYTQKGFAQLDYMSVAMVDRLFQPETNMGFAGIHYNLWLHKNFYGGAGFYGSVSGKRGGLFTLGINLGAKYNFTDRFFVDTGVHFGGGGGASAHDGGGAMILPHLNLGYQFKKFSATAGWSYINFFDKGFIKGNQVNFAVQIPISFNYTSFKNREKTHTINDLKSTDWNVPSKRISLMVHLNNLSPFGKSKFTDGTTLKGKTIRLAGFEINTYLNNNWFMFLKADGAYHGIQGGYMDILLGGGYHLGFNKNRTNILAKFGIGAGGGGGVDSAGGFLIYPDISLEQKLIDDVYISINKGFLMSPDAYFANATLGFGLKYYVNQSGIFSEEKTFTSSRIKGVEFILGHDMYINANRYTEPTEHLHQIGLQINMYATKHIYFSGKTSFANFGNAGAYAEGIVGIGIRSNNFANDKLSVFIQGLAGAAGGGDISTGQGLIVKPSAGLYINLNRRLSLRGEVGYIKARGGSLSSLFGSLGISYQIGTLISR